MALTKPQLVTNGMMGNGLNTPKSTGSPTTNGVGTGYTDKGVATRLCDEAPSAADKVVKTPTGGRSINDAMKQEKCRTGVGIEHGVGPSQTDKALTTAGVPIMVTTPTGGMNMKASLDQIVCETGGMIVNRVGHGTIDKGLATLGVTENKFGKVSGIVNKLCAANRNGKDMIGSPKKLNYKAKHKISKVTLPDWLIKWQTKCAEPHPPLQ